MILYFGEMSGVFVVKRQFENFSEVPLLSDQFRDVLVKCWVGGNTAEVLKENSFSSFFGYTHLKCSSQKFLTHLYCNEIEIQLKYEDFCLNLKHVGDILDLEMLHILIESVNAI